MSRLTTSALYLLVSAPFLSAESPVDFRRDVRPILSDNCLECHGPDEAAREADLRLDTPEGAFTTLFGSTPIVPGNPDESEVIYRITTTDRDERMPPADSKKDFTKEDAAILTRWIEQGAAYDEHWAWQVPQKKTLPIPAAHPIDAWVNHELQKQNLTPQPTAPPRTLVRRIFLDLIGLPPSPAEIDQFLAAYASNPPAAIDTLIDELLTRPAYGEKWGRHWLDLARYSDTNGFEKDKPRDQWIYRDWVINALNADMPYDQFLTEQLAGDLLPDRTQAQLIASGFMRNGMINEEGAIVPEQFRIEGIVDRMDTFGKTTLGLTVQCAQCHTHKFDPITHDEYFSLFAFFNETHEAKSWIYSDKQLKYIADLRTELSTLDEKVRDENPTWEIDLAIWEETQRATHDVWTIWDTDSQTWKGGLNHPEELDDHSILTLGHPTVTGFSITEGDIPIPAVTGLRLEALLHGDQPFRGPGRSYWGTFAISEVEVFSQLPDSDEWTEVKLASATADFATETGNLKKYFDHELQDPENKRRIGPAKFLVDGDKTTGWAPDRGPVLRHTESAAVVVFEAPLQLPPGSRLKVQLAQDHGGDGNDRKNQQLGRYRFALTDAPSPRATDYDHAALLALLQPPDQRTAADQAAIFTAWRQTQDTFAELNAAAAKITKKFPEAYTSVLHSEATSPEFARTTRLLDRGVWDQPKHKVPRGVLAVLNPLAAKNPTRLDLAAWVTAPDAPLTARVQVNRVWQTLFGAGLVITSDDFGTRAPLPEHLELLDWLAVDFRENGWSSKQLLKTILTSAAYQRSSTVTPELWEIDPRNRLFARGPRFRAEAEVIRDIALTASGLLTQKLGGPSFYPPVPASVLDYNYVKPDYWDPATGPERYRRSLYMFRKRSMPDPSLSSFDAPNGDASCARRERSNTPLSALTSLNEPIFVEAAQALALRILQEGGNDTAARTNYGYLLTTGRPAGPQEIDAISELLTSQDARLAEGWLDIRQIAFPDPNVIPELPDGVIPRDVAKWAMASRVLLNLDETISKN
jgi:hypothetical protein